LFLASPFLRETRAKWKDYIDLYFIIKKLKIFILFRKLSNKRKAYLEMNLMKKFLESRRRVLRILTTWKELSIGRFWS